MTQPPTNFSYCNPVKTSLHLVCRVLVPRDSTTVNVDWYWSKNINECGKNITEEQGRFIISITRGYAPQFNSDRINADLTIEYPETDTGYYWCQVNDPSYNGVFISSNKAPVFDTGTMITCSGTQSVIMTTCAITSNINTLSFLMCFISTQTVFPSMLTSRYRETAMSISDIKSILSTMTITVTVMSGTTSRKSSKTLTDGTSTEMYTTTSLITTNIILTTSFTSDIKTVADTTLNFKSSTVTDHDSTSTEMYPITSLIITSVVSTINLTNDVKTVADNSISQKSSTFTDSTSTNVFNPSFISQNTGIQLTDSIITSIVSTPMYNDITDPFATNNITLIISISLVILLIISMLSCGVIVVIVIIKRRKTYKTNNGK